MTAGTQLGAANWLSFFGSFILVACLIGAMFLLLRRLNAGKLGKRRERNISVIESHALGEKQRLILVRVKDRELLIGGSVQQLSLLASWNHDLIAHTEHTDYAPGSFAAPTAGPITGADLKAFIARI